MPARSSHLPRTAGPAMCPPTVLLRIEFTAADCSQPSGELLPRLSTLASSQAPAPSLCRKRQSSVTSLLLLFAPKQASMRVRGMGRFAVYLCCTFPEVAFGGRYPLSLPCGARTFLTHRLSPCARGRSAHSPLDFTASDPNCQSKRAETDKSARWQILCFTSALK